MVDNSVAKWAALMAVQRAEQWVVWKAVTKVDWRVVPWVGKTAAHWAVLKAPKLAEWMVDCSVAQKEAMWAASTVAWSGLQ